ncbi:hypothetical protein [Spirosoma gilvum]
MKNILGKLIGFVLGLTGFLYLFKLLILDTTPPEDELAPGIVVIMSILSGLFFAYLGNLLQNYSQKQKY